MRRKLLIWSAVTAAASSVLGMLMIRPDAMESLPVRRTVFLPGETTHGHYQIELDCGACHVKSFSDPARMQEACERCHGAELERVDDSHPQTKFNDPRNADRVARLDARWCVTCHREHRPGITGAMGLSLPGDYCFRCHEKVGEDRPTHRDLPFDSCASAGCHNFHDNQALYEDFLVDHRDEPDLKRRARVPERNLLAWALERGVAPGDSLGAADHDAPAALHELVRWISEWQGSSHAAAGVNCSACHAEGGAPWTDRPGLEACRGCHAEEAGGFLGGRHGMRLAAGLPPMTPRMARLPMREDAGDAALDCNRCHPAHAFDTRHAEVDACLGCHADRHSLAYWGSPHSRLREAELDGRGASGSGVSCATCHLPRVRSEPMPERVLVAHNQNDHLRPNEKMIRSSCLQCHGLGFSLSALADPGLIENGFRGGPRRRVESIHFAAVLRWELEGRLPPWTMEEKER